MTVSRIKGLPVAIEQRLIDELRDLIAGRGPDYLGDLYRLNDWKSYDNNVFLNACLFGSPERKIKGISLLLYVDIALYMTRAKHS